MESYKPKVFCDWENLHTHSCFSLNYHELTRALCPVHNPDNVRTAARIISGLPVSIM